MNSLQIVAEKQKVFSAGYYHSLFYWISFHSMPCVWWSFCLFVLSSLDTKHVDLCFLNDQKIVLTVIESFFHSHGDLIDTFFFRHLLPLTKKSPKKRKDENRSLAIESLNHVRFHKRWRIYINISINNNNSIHSFIQRDVSK